MTLRKISVSFSGLKENKCIDLFFFLNSIHSSANCSPIYNNLSESILFIQLKYVSLPRGLEICVLYQYLQDLSCEVFYANIDLGRVNLLRIPRDAMYMYKCGICGNIHSQFFITIKMSKWKFPVSYLKYKFSTTHPKCYFSTIKRETRRKMMISHLVWVE